MKKDISARLAHKKPYTHIETEPEKAIDLLIVVDQMLTGFDSKWINTLYLDKIIEYENIIQAFSRTNRLFGPEKPFGSVKYYRKPCTMERNIERALKLYSGNQQFSLFAEKLASNLSKVNDYFNIIRDIFRTSGIPDFSRIPDLRNERKEFAINFIALTEHLEASKIQGFVWEQKEYRFSDPAAVITVELDKLTYEILSLRYLELTSGGGGEWDGDDLPGEAFVLTGHLQSVGTGKIDSSYMNSRFEKYLKELHSGDPEIRDALLTELHRTFATLSQEDQRHAQSFLNDVQSGEVKLEPGKTFSDYVAEYGRKDSDDLISFIANAYGLDEVLLREMKLLPITSDNLDEYGRFTRLRESVDKVRARDFIQNVTGETLTTTKALVKMTRSLRDYILNDHFEYDNRDRDRGHGRS